MGSCLVMHVVYLVGVCTIGVGTGGGGGGGARALPIFYPRALLIFIHAAQIAAIAVYITFGPSKMELLPTHSYGLHQI